MVHWPVIIIMSRRLGKPIKSHQPQDASYGNGACHGDSRTCGNQALREIAAAAFKVLTCRFRTRPPQVLWRALSIKYP
jgi:hypothetical protein